MDRKPLPAQDDYFTLAVKILPGASADAIMGEQGDKLVIKIAAPPEKGKANAALIAFLAKTLGIAKREVVLFRGETSHHKLLRLPNACRALVEKYRARLPARLPRAGDGKAGA